MSELSANLNIFTDLILNPNVPEDVKDAIEKLRHEYLNVVAIALSGKKVVPQEKITKIVNQINQFKRRYNA